MKVQLNINIGKPKIHIIKDDKQDEHIDLLVEQIVNNVMNHPEYGTKVKALGMDKLKQLARENIKALVEAEEQKQIEDAIEMADEFNAALVAGVINGVTDFNFLTPNSK